MDLKQQLGDYAPLTRDDWTQRERENLLVVVGFLQTLRSMDFDRLEAEYGDHPYVQHNVTMETGVAGVANEGRKTASRFPDFAIEAKRVFVDGDYVIIQSHMTAKVAHRGNDRAGMNVMDVWQVSDGKIVEHWDTIQPLDFVGRLFSLILGGAVRNSNGVF